MTLIFVFSCVHKFYEEIIQNCVNKGTVNFYMQKISLIWVLSLTLNNNTRTTELESDLL